MARYVIYDTESKTPVEMKGGRTGTMHGRFLSPEETEAKWRDVFNYGICTGRTSADYGGVSDEEIESDWEELKQTL